MPAISKYYRSALLCSNQLTLRSTHLNTTAKLPLATPQLVLTPKREKSSFVKRVSPKVGETRQSGSLATSKQEVRASLDTSEKENVFGDYRLAYRTKSTWELSRALGIFLMCRFPSFADNAIKVRLYNVCQCRVGKQIAS